MTGVELETKVLGPVFVGVLGILTDKGIVLPNELPGDNPRSTRSAPITNSTGALARAPRGPSLSRRLLTRSELELVRADVRSRGAEGRRGAAS